MQIRNCDRQTSINNIEHCATKMSHKNIALNDVFVENIFFSVVYFLNNMQLHYSLFLEKTI